MDIKSDEIRIEKIILRVATGDAGGSASLLEDATAATLIDQVSAWAERMYKQDRDEIRQALALQILTSIHTLRNPRKLRLWLHLAARNYCFKEIRHRKSENQALERGPVVASQVSTPEQLLLEKEEREERDALLGRLRQVTSEFPADIVDMWASGKSPKEIAQQAGRPVSTVYRILRNLQRAITEQLRRDQSKPSLEQVRSERAPSMSAQGDVSTTSDSRESRRAGPDVVEVGSQAAPISDLSTEQILSAMERLEAVELEKLVPRAIALGAARRAPHLKRKESKLMDRANEALPAQLKSRLAKLQQKRDARTLTEAEFEELTALSDRVEQLHSERLEALAHLANLRGSTLTSLMDQLGIRFPDNA